MLQQNWFYSENMEMFHEDYIEQWFFDKKTKCIYLVSDELDNVTIVQIEEDSENYQIYYNKYLEWKSQNLSVQLFIQECERKLSNTEMSEEKITEVYNTETIDISILGMTTKIPWGAEPYNRIIDALNLLLEEGEVE